jgi:hypothetical protein
VPGTEIGEWKWSRKREWQHEHAFDLSPEGERMRRYETTCQRYVHQFFGEVAKRKGNRADHRYLPLHREYRASGPTEFRRTYGPSGSPEMASQSELIELLRRREHERAAAAVGAVPSKEAAAPTEQERWEPTASPVKNEPNAACDASLPQDATELEITSKREVTDDPQTGRVLRNEANGAMTAERRTDMGATKVEGGSRRERRARRARERAKRGR